VKSVAVLLLLIPFNSGLLSLFGPAQVSYTESYPVRAGTSSAASGGRLGYPNVHVSGSLKVKSCCGLSTNDIIFVIENEVSGRRDFGVVVGTLNFEWNTGNYTEYSMIFGNTFDPASPSYHNKTVEISVSEVGPPNSINLFFVFEVIGIATVTVATVVAGSVFLLMRRGKRRGTASSNVPTPP